jgi:hypothetical protein
LLQNTQYYQCQHPLYLLHHIHSKVQFWKGVNQPICFNITGLKIHITLKCPTVEYNWLPTVYVSYYISLSSHL